MIFRVLNTWEIAPGPFDSRPLQRSGFEPDSWTSQNSASALRSHPDAARPLVPMRELLVSSFPSGKPEEYRRVWEAQAELFMRWALSNRVKDGGDRLRRFVEAAGVRPTSEELFRLSFGMDYADAFDSLSDYLPLAVSDTLNMPSREDAPPQLMELRDATPAQIHRIKGEWARRTLRVIKEDYPRALPLYVEKTGKVLQGAYDRGERDPSLLASLALFRIDIGDVKGGQSILEQFPQAGASRPVAAISLANLHLLDALRQPKGPRGALGEEQAAGVLREISAVLQEPPPIEAAYVIAARVAEHLGRDPNDSERARLDEGARLFPRNSQLVIQSAAWDLRAGNAAGALSLTDLGMWEASDPSAREKLAVLNDLARKASLRPN
jgi:hypothetical protein